MSHFEAKKEFILAALNGHRCETIVVSESKTQRAIRLISVLRDDKPILSYYEVLFVNEIPLQFASLDEAVSCYVEREVPNAP